MKAISHMRKLDNATLQKRNELIDFINLFELAFNYSLDHQPGGLYERTLSGSSGIAGIHADLARKLDEIFFKDIYVDIPQRKGVENYIKSTNNLIFLVGLVGIGKTTLMRKLEKEFIESQDTKVILINFKSDTYRLRGKSPEETNLELRKLLCNHLYRTIIPKEEINKLQYYDILFDTAFEDIKYEIDRLVGYRTETVNELEKENECIGINGMIKGITPNDRLNSIINYLLFNQIKFVILFDNLDRLPYKKQIEVSILARELTEKYGMPIVVAIRSTNIQQIVKEMRNAAEECDPLGSIFYFETITPIFNKNEKYFKIEPSDTYDIKRMIQRRYEILNDRTYFESLLIYKNNFLEKKQMTSEEFDIKFWQVLDRITYDFVENGFYKYSNYNLREMFKQYVSFVTTLLFNPEDDYLWDKFILDNDTINLTKLKTFILKWQIANGKIIPEDPINFVNIFNSIPKTISMLDYLLLVYLYNKFKENRHKNLYAKDMYEDFQRLNVEPDVIHKRLEALSEPRSEKHLGLIWLDTQDEEPVGENSLIILNPASEYFLSILSNKREYALWAGITADLPIDIVGHSFDLSDTYNNSFKLDVTCALIEKVLLPQLKDDIQNYILSINLPRNWVGSKYQYFAKYFLRDSRFYVDHLITSITAVIDESEGIDKDYYHNLYKSLKTKFKHTLKLSGK